MVERNVLVSNLMSFLDAAISGMIALSLRNAQKATFYDEGTINAPRRARTSFKFTGKSAIPPNKNK
jgi:hypothetical protein